MIHVREVDEIGLQGVIAIDVTESGEQRVQFVDGELHVIEQTWQRPFWDAESWPHRLESWAQKLKPDLYVAAYDGKQMVGIAGLRYQLTATMAQLTSLYIDANHRRLGIAGLLVKEVFRLTMAHGAHAIYVSSKPSLPAVGFYTRQGFRVTSEPDPRLFALQPLDIHMIKPFTDDYSEDS